ncbi:hypothetical protein MMC28_009486 [Mycoblastus sanguinarius]|nr:hypothetical protein [Mycoblastus sanguinarius]
MPGSDTDPISRPNSANDGLPVLVQLQLVDTELEKNPLPRTDFGRHFSLTPERHTPESQRTPVLNTPSDLDPAEELRDAKAWAAQEAKSLQRFYLGRELLREEEPEQHGIFSEDPYYWRCQARHWLSETYKHVNEFETRKLSEQRGDSKEGYARTLLISPIQSPSPPPSNDTSSTAINLLGEREAICDGSPRQRINPEHPQPEVGLHLRISIPIPELTMKPPSASRKRLRSELDLQEDCEHSRQPPTRRRLKREGAKEARPEPKSIRHKGSSHRLGQEEVKVSRSKSKVSKARLRYMIQPPSTSPKHLQPKSELQGQSGGVSQPRQGKRQKRMEEEEMESIPAHKSDGEATPLQGLRKRKGKIARSNTGQVTMQKGLQSTPSMAPRNLPWSLRSQGPLKNSGLHQARAGEILS